MKKSYISPEFEFRLIELSDPICGSKVEDNKSQIDTDPNDWGDEW